ncbi:MAG: hypothetical protein AAF624_13490 [Bacteroidota bacterium]
MAAASSDHNTSSQLDELFDGVTDEMNLLLYDSEEKAVLALVREQCRLYLSAAISRNDLLWTAGDLYGSFNENETLFRFHVAAHAFADHESIEGGLLTAEALLREAIDSLQPSDTE